MRIGGVIISGRFPDQKETMRRVLDLIISVTYLIIIPRILYTAAVSAFGQKTQLVVMNTLIPAAIHNTL